jgi:hypothetical protein
MPAQELDLARPAKPALIAGAAVGVAAIVLDRSVVPWALSAAALVYFGSLIFGPAGAGQHMVGGADMLLHAQIRLSQLGYPVKITGTNDSATTAAVKQFQETYDLTHKNGEVDSETIAYLDQLVKQQSSTPQPFTPDTGYHERTTTWTGAR